MSAIVAGLIPKIEGFQPIPNAVMIPFMEVQSAALAYGFGLNYEFSKRKIRSMSNEQFNALTPQDIEEMQARHTAVLLEGFIKRVPAVMPAQAQIFTQYVAIEKLKVQQNVELAKWMVKYAKETIDDATAHLLGGHIHGTQDQTYYDPNNPDKDFVPTTQPTSDFPPSGVPKTNIPVPIPPPVPVKVPFLETPIKVIRVGARDVFLDMLTTKPLRLWLILIKSITNVMNQAVVAKDTSRVNKAVGSLYLIRLAIHEKTGKWY